MTCYPQIRRFAAAVAFAGLGCAMQQVLAAPIVIPTAPLYVGASVQPLVMLDITKDQNLYKKAYDDYSDLDGDGWAETTYDHTIDYYGYFDSYKCYSYSTTNGYFSPVAAPSVDANDKFIKPTTCSGQWHGNFLNWVAMSRMDTVRKLLYGGYRSTDTGTLTVLERAYIPTDAHAWAKYYNPDIAKALDVWPGHQATLDARYPTIDKLTPFNPPTTPAAISSSSAVFLGGTPGIKTFNVGSDKSKFSHGDQVRIEVSADPTKFMIGVVSCVDGAGVNMFNGLASNANSCSSDQIRVVVESSVGGTNSYSSWKIFNYTQTGISICNATPGGSSGKSQASTSAPLMRVAQGNFSLWAANERWQCYWREDSRSPGEDTGTLGGTMTNGNRAALSGIWAGALGPNKTAVADGKVANGLGNYDYNVRVKACDSTMVGDEKCAKYPSANLKPIGLLQFYGESGQLKFGLMTGSYQKNKSGGVLRKNISNISDEINTTTDGTFKTTLPGTGSIIASLGRMRVFDYDYADGTYGGSCSFGKTQFSEGNCRSWGNPMSEIYLESLRYLAGKTPNPSFDVVSDDLFPPRPTWSDPLTTQNYCAPLNVLMFNSASSTNENDGQFGSASDLGITGDTADATT